MSAATSRPRRLWLLVLVALLGGCGPSATSSFGCSRLIDAHLSLPNREDVSGFVDLDLETQYKVYLCGVQNVHPPLTSLVSAFAAEGEPAAHLLREKLQTAPTDVAIVDIIEVFDEMHRSGSYDTVSDTELMMEIEAKVAQMRSPGWRDFAERLLVRMRQREEVRRQEIAPP